MSKKKINYAEGDFFILPLEDHGFARGVVARLDGKGQVLGYFYGPRLSSLESGRGFDEFKPEDAVFICMFGDLGFLERKWTVLGRVANWNRDKWPVPPMIRVDEFENKAWLSYYDQDSLEFLDEERVDPALVTKYPEDGLFGYEAAEIQLAMLIEEAEKQ